MIVPATLMSLMNENLALLNLNTAGLALPDLPKEAPNANGLALLSAMTGGLALPSSSIEKKGAGGLALPSSQLTGMALPSTVDCLALAAPHTADSGLLTAALAMLTTAT